MPPLLLLADGSGSVGGSMDQEPVGHGAVCPNGHSVGEGSIFCPQCGAAVEQLDPDRRCANGHELGPDDQFCSVCGLPAAAAVTATAVAPIHSSPRRRQLLGLGVGLLVLLLIGGGAYLVGRSTGSGASRKISAASPTSTPAIVTTTTAPTTTAPATTTAPTTATTAAPTTTVATNSAALAYRDLQGTWKTTGFTVTFLPGTGGPGELTTSDLGGAATPTATEAHFTGVAAGGGELFITYDFVRAPNVITVNDGSSTYEAERVS